MKGKSIWSTVIALLLVCFILTGCGHEHKFGSWQADAEASCTEIGSRHRACEVVNCQETESEVLPSLGHTPADTEERTEPTCTEDGEIRVYCRDCGEIISTEKLPAAGHTPGSWVTVKEASCTEEGEREQLCSSCGEVISTEKLPAAGHTPGEWVTVKEASCTEQGERARLCEDCGEICETMLIPETEHSGEWKTVREMNWDQTGLRRLTCTICGETIEEEIPIEFSCSLSDAAAKGIIDTEVSMSAIKNGTIRVRNLTEHPLTLLIPAGTYLVSGSKSNQNMLVTKSSEHELAIGEEKSISLDTACMNIHRNIPGSGDAYSVGFTDNRTLQRLVELFEENNSGYAVRQAAVWIVTDNASYEDTGILVSNNSRYISKSAYDEASRLVQLARQ